MNSLILICCIIAAIYGQTQSLALQDDRVSKNSIKDSVKNSVTDSIENSATTSIPSTTNSTTSTLNPTTNSNTNLKTLSTTNSTKYSIPFDPAKFCGMWYTHAKNFDTEIIDGRCFRTILQPNGKNHWSVLFSGISNITGEMESIVGTAEIEDEIVAHAYYYINSSNQPMQVDYYVAATDYINWAVVYSCKYVGLECQPQIRFNTRIPNDLSHDHHLTTALTAMGVNTTMIKINHTDCGNYF